LTLSGLNGVELGTAFCVELGISHGEQTNGRRCMRCPDGEERRGNKEVEEEGKWVSETRVRKKAAG